MSESYITSWLDRVEKYNECVEELSSARTHLADEVAAYIQSEARKIIDSQVQVHVDVEFGVIKRVDIHTEDILSKNQLLGILDLVDTEIEVTAIDDELWLSFETDVKGV